MKNRAEMEYPIGPRFPPATISYPESSGSLVSGLVARRDSGEMEIFPRNLGFRLLCACLAL